MKKLYILLTLLLIQNCISCGFGQKKAAYENNGIKSGCEQTNLYLPLITGKRVGMVVNHTSNIQKTHLVDSLLKLGIKINTIFAPEHGFRGTADAGETIQNGKDKATGLPIISLYGKHKKPTPEDFANLDIILFDIQDVGVRFYTYISTLHYVMEACAENHKPLIVLDRPNPNAHYIDGPILQPEFKSFIGMHPIPVVYGMTIGELAKMINGEGWLNNHEKAELTVIPNANYTHSSKYILPIKPSPNLPNNQSIWLYPSICFFEGTNISVGRGTDLQFQVIGGTNKVFGTYSFTPIDKAGANNPPNEGLVCYGENLSFIDAYKQKFTLKYVLEYYKKSGSEDSFFLKTNHFNLLAGNSELKIQIIEGKTESEIRKTWESGLQNFKANRAKYLIYSE